MLTWSFSRIRSSNLSAPSGTSMQSVIDASHSLRASLSCTPYWKASRPCVMPTVTDSRFTESADASGTPGMPMPFSRAQPGFAE